MADDFQLGSGNWWEASRGRFDGETTSASIPTSLSAIGSSFGWPTEMADMKPRSSMDSPGSMVLHGGADQSAAAGGGVLADNSVNLQMMGLGLPSQGLDWGQALFRDEKGESSFRSVIQEADLSSNTGSFQAAAESSSQDHWTQKLYSGAASPDDSSVHDFRGMNNHRGFSLDQPQYSSPGSSTNVAAAISSAHSLNPSFQLDTAAYGLLLPETQPHHSAYETPRGTTMNFPYPPPNADAGLIPTWNKFPQAFLRTSPPKPPPPPGSGTHLHFTNNTPFWNASANPAAAAAADARPSFFPDIRTQIPSASSFDEKPKSSSEPRDLSTTTKKTSSETSNKRPRNETPSPLPAFKVRKEKMGDRITALQQLVSPFGKTDTASVLSEAIEYIKFLHEQVSVLSTPYMKNGAPIQHQQNPDKSNKDAAEGPRQDLRSRGLCLVPVSSTFPMTHETTVDFWTPTFGGSYR